MRFGSLCKSRRVQLGLGLKQVAADTGLSLESMSKIENGKQQPRIGTVVSLIRVLKITPKHLDDLYGGLWPTGENNETSVSDAKKVPWYLSDNA